VEASERSCSVSEGKRIARKTTEKKATVVHSVHPIAPPAPCPWEGEQLERKPARAKRKEKKQKLHPPGIEPGARQDRLLEKMAMPNFTTKPQVRSM
jgi:hypothetical protein